MKLKEWKFNYGNLKMSFHWKLNEWMIKISETKRMGIK